MTRFLALALAAALALPAPPVLANPDATTVLNTLRQAHSRPKVRYSKTLEAAAQAHAEDMARRGFFAHQGSNGSSVSDRIAAQGYKWCFAAENIAKGQKNLREVMQGWANSRGHYRNMTHRKVREFGLARGPKDYWVMVLAAPC
jgi:uncharacterized protein YkwD